ncbi:MAG: hypothetical protein KGL26_11370 [Pseudomonadota bacterium]|nr:hypothetical protein [Pseudomonadota bacterium]
MAPLYQALLADARFHALLLDMDADIAAACRSARCSCGGVLHSANFRRKPRGRPIGLGEEHDRRFSFCCAVDGCRDRATPPSLRFLGRKVYLATIVTLISAMRNGVTAARLRRLSGALGVDRRTIARWRAWWLSTFTAMPFWQAASAAFMPPADSSRLPASVLDRFAGDADQRLIAFLRFLAPITGGASMRHAF